jgi:hypothetical protein
MESGNGQSEPAYLRLVGKFIDIDITSLPAVLGRQSKNKADDEETSPDEPLFISLGNSKILSRKHAMVSWENGRGYCIECFSKNGVSLNGHMIFPKDAKVPLPNRTRIEMAEIVFYVLHPSRYVE